VKTTANLFQICEITVNYSSRVKPSNRPKIAGSRNAYEIVLPLWDDITLTRKMKECGKFLDLPVLDHLIVTTDGYFSFANEGLI